MLHVLFLKYSFLLLICSFSGYVKAEDFNRGVVVPDYDVDNKDNTDTKDDGSYLSFQRHFDNITNEEMMAIGGNNATDDTSQYKMNLKSSTFHQLKYTNNIFKNVLPKTINNLDIVSWNISKIYSPIDVVKQQNNIINHDIDISSGYDRFFFLKRDFTRMNVYATKNPFLYFTIVSKKIIPSLIEMQYYCNLFDAIYCSVVLDFHNAQLLNNIYLTYSTQESGDEDDENNTKKTTRCYYYSNCFSSGGSLYINCFYTTKDRKSSFFSNVSFCYLPVRETGGVNSSNSQIKYNTQNNISDYDHVQSLYLQHNLFFYFQQVLNLSTVYVQLCLTSENNEVNFSPLKYDTKENISEECKKRCLYIQGETKGFCHLQDFNVGQYFTTSAYFIKQYCEVGVKAKKIRVFSRLSSKQYVTENVLNKDLSHYFLDSILSSLIIKHVASLSGIVYSLFESIYTMSINRTKNLNRQKEDFFELLVGINAKYIGADIDVNLLTDFNTDWPIYWNINMKYQFGKYVKFKIGYLCRQTDIFHAKHSSVTILNLNLKKQHEVPICIVLNDCKINNKISLEASLVYLIKFNGIYNQDRNSLFGFKSNQAQPHVGNVLVAQNTDIISKMTMNFAVYMQFSNSFSLKPNISILKKFINFFETSNVNNNERLDNVPLCDIKLEGTYKMTDLDGKHCTTYGSVIHFITPYVPDKYDVVSQQFYNQYNDDTYTSLIPYIDIFLCYKYEDLLIKFVCENVLSIFSGYAQIQAPYYAHTRDILKIIIQYNLD